MVKEAIADLGLTPYAVYGLLTFFGVYAAITVWTMTRLYQQVSAWASLPLDDDRLAADLGFADSGADSGAEPSVEFGEPADDFERTYDDRECVSRSRGDRSKHHANDFVSLN